jgi:hypothetical protein
MAVTNKNLLIKANKEKKLKAVESLSGDKDKTLVLKKKKSKEELRRSDAELVRGRFNFNNVTGGTLTFSYKKYEKNAKSYTFVDGGTYTIPRGVAKHIATTGAYPVHKYITDEHGRSIIAIKRMNRRYTFESLDFFDDPEVSSANSDLYSIT